jgi:hypothetical protein
LSLLLALSLPASALGPEAERFSAESWFRAFQGLHLHPLELRGPAERAMPPLDFSGVTWSESLTLDDRKALGIALNISGSYEGNSGWGNIANNFDGQGVSLGLLNQNLGQGSLQPMLIRMRDEHPDVLKAIFRPEHLKSLLAMLSRWEKASKLETPSPTLSILDEPVDSGERSANSESVEWAEENLYDGFGFDPVWKKELVALAEHPDYVSYQIAAAEGYHQKALKYQARIGIRELRAYLLLFDIVVQNGSLYEQDLTDYEAYVKANPSATSTQKLEKLVELRIRHVREEYKADVRARKKTIINGTGTVHGERRNLPKEYSYDPIQTYR